VAGIAKASCETTNTLLVTLSRPGQMVGAYSVRRRKAWKLTQGMVTHTVGLPELRDNLVQVLLPIGGRWLPGPNIEVRVAAEDVHGDVYDDPGVVECPPLVEQHDDGGPEPVRPPRDDFESSRDTGGLTAAGGSYRHHWGEAQLKKVVERWLLSQPPFGIGLQLGVPLTPSEVSRLEVGVRRMLLEQTDITESLVHFLPRPRADVLVVQIGIQTPEGWRDFTLQLGE